MPVMGRLSLALACLNAQPYCIFLVLAMLLSRSRGKPCPETVAQARDTARPSGYGSLTASLLPSSLGFTDTERYNETCGIHSRGLCRSVCADVQTHTAPLP